MSLRTAILGSLENNHDPAPTAFNCRGRNLGLCGRHTPPSTLGVRGRGGAGGPSTDPSPDSGDVGLLAVAGQPGQAGSRAGLGQWYGGSTARSLMDGLPDYGKHLGVWTARQSGVIRRAKWITAAGSPRTWSRTGGSTRPGAWTVRAAWENVERGVGYGLHLIADTQYELPVLCEQVEALFDDSPALAARCQDFSADWDYDQAGLNPTWHLRGQGGFCVLPLARDTLPPMQKHHTPTECLQYRNLTIYGTFD